MEAAPGSGDPRSGLRSRAGRILPVALGSARRQATPPCGHCPGGSSCGSGNCSHPSPGSGYSPPPPASRARPGKPCSSLRRVLSPCAKLGVWKRAETGLLSRVSTLEPERRPPGCSSEKNGYLFELMPELYLFLVMPLEQNSIIPES